MAGLIEDYAIVGDMQSAALIGRDGSVAELGKLGAEERWRAIRGPLIQSALNLEEHAGHHCRRPARKTSLAP